MSFRTLNNNNLTTLPRDLFVGLRLRALRLSDNPFACDCHLSWLSRYLRTAFRLAPNTKCLSPSQLKAQSLADLHEQDFKCSGKLVNCEFSPALQRIIFICADKSPAGLTENAPVECGARSSCPHPCRCAEGIVDCREKSLTAIPSSLPDDTTEL